MRILFIAHTNIGDVVLSTILLNRMIHDYPNAVVDVACGAKTMDLFQGLPNLGELVPVVKKKHHGHYFDLWKRFRKTKYDYVVDMRGSLLPTFLKKKKVIRFANNNKKVHKGLQLADLYPSDLSVSQRVWLSPDVLEPVAGQIEQLKSKGPVIGLGPTSNWHAKTWPQRKFAILVSEILALPGYENATFILFGAAHERRSVRDLVDYIPSDRLVDLVGETSLGEAGAWMQAVDVFIGHDSGLSHLAAALDIPTISLFGPTPDELYAPVTSKGVVVSAPYVDDVNLRPEAPKRLITDISPSMVMHAFKEMFNIEEIKEEEPAVAEVLLTEEIEEDKESISA